VTLASLVELLAWTDLRSSIIPTLRCCDDNSLEIAGARASVIVLPVVDINLDGPTAS
jgi:hypothetical protein